MSFGIDDSELTGTIIFLRMLSFTISRTKLEMRNESPFWLVSWSFSKIFLTWSIHLRIQKRKNRNFQQPKCQVFFQKMTFLRLINSCTLISMSFLDLQNFNFLSDILAYWHHENVLTFLSPFGPIFGHFGIQIRFLTFLY